MQTDPLLSFLWLWAIRYVARGVTLGTMLREVEDFARIFRPDAQA